MRSVSVVVLDVLVEELFELSVVPDERPVEELAPYCADPSFGVCVCDRRVRRCANDRRAITAEDLIERADELAGAVADQEPDRRFGTRHEIPGGLCGPGTGRVAGHAGEVHAASVEFDEEQYVVAAEQHGVDGKEVARDDSCGLGAQECRARF